ncbi:hypothetical protein [Novosphingobium sp.]|jgi:hypothetical protein|uniref:hypothetical protein n=1 Tax=Novosphingobium sp. TaxID=1874826 RepID=UPI0022BCB1D2|nr:hypothetical protein [Novosphingobium sp.]MCZ8019396.1 hypothetical protein [Novosphingobium sp.]MCZ8035211.1 hypothetical protein [Novosphingobium sp.]MCZ8050525.1 hypothetical protein [Novosphingobium sp.]MCZ8058871.1 hypothetical protein [Novosphingobium sp.]MCZ8232316.1 hypothetical protein [Novosphingobium sp.]
MSHLSALPVLTDLHLADKGATPDPDTAPDAGDVRSLFTRPRQVAFLAALAATGSVRSASATAGISHQTAYRARLASPGFRRGWDAALLAARAQAEEVLACRALEGWEEDVVYHGEVVASRRRFSDRLLLAHLARLDRLCGDAEVAEFADRFDEVLARYEAGEDRPARPPEPAPEPAPEVEEDGPSTGSGRAGVGVDSEGDGFLSPGLWSMWSTRADEAEDGAAIPPPLPAVLDRDGAAFSEAQRLHIGLYGVWWHDGEGCLLTNWPAPADWDGEQFARQPPHGELVPLAEDPALAADLAEMSDEARAEAGWLRTLTEAEEAGLEAVAAAQEEARVARRDLYHRAAFGLASPAELVALARANPDQPGPWLAEVLELEEGG